MFRRHFSFFKKDEVSTDESTSVSANGEEHLDKEYVSLLLLRLTSDSQTLKVLVGRVAGGIVTVLGLLWIPFVTSLRFVVDFILFHPTYWYPSVHSFTSTLIK